MEKTKRGRLNPKHEAEQFRYYSEIFAIIANFRYIAKLHYIAKITLHSENFAMQ